jgi:hypothetical protein
MSPHETLLIESTNSLEVSESPPNPHIQFLIMDFPGDVDFAEVRLAFRWGECHHPIRIY